MLLRTCKNCGETKPFERGSWRWSKAHGPHGMLCLVCYRAMNKLAMRKHMAKADNRLKHQASSTLWRSRVENKPRILTNQKRWYIENPGKRNHYSIASKVRRLKRQPAWADKTKLVAFYSQAVSMSADTDIQYAVDHVVPLLSSNVSGLHVENNLQVLTFSENSSKGNRWDPEKSGFSFIELRSLFQSFDQQVKELS